MNEPASKTNGARCGSGASSQSNPMLLSGQWASLWACTKQTCDSSDSEAYACGDDLSSGHGDTDEDYEEDMATNKRRRCNRRSIKMSEDEGEGEESGDEESTANGLERSTRKLDALQKQLGTKATKTEYANLSLKEQLRRWGPTRNRKPSKPLRIKSHSFKWYDVCINESDDEFANDEHQQDLAVADEDDGMELEDEVMDISEPRVVANASWRRPAPPPAAVPCAQVVAEIRAEIRAAEAAKSKYWLLRLPWVTESRS